MLPSLKFVLQRMTALNFPVSPIKPEHSAVADEMMQSAPEHSVVAVEMMQSASEHPAVAVKQTPPERGRKRMRSREKRKKSIRKRRRNSGEQYVTDRSITKSRRQMKKGCGVSCRLHCHSKILSEDREKLFHAYWKLGDTTRQREFIVKHCTKAPVRSSKVCRNSRRKCTLSYCFKCFFGYTCYSWPCFTHSLK